MFHCCREDCPCEDWIFWNTSSCDPGNDQIHSQWRRGGHDDGGDDDDGGHVSVFDHDVVVDDDDGGDHDYVFYY